MNGTSLLLAIIGHLVGDYLLQNDWMARNKKRQSVPCVTHCILWTFSVILFAGWVNMQFKGLAIMGILFATHFIQDRTNIIRFWMLRINGQRAPWSVIVVDNVWHIVTIWAVWRWIA